MTYVAADGRLAGSPVAAAGIVGCCCPGSRSGCGRTSATASRSRSSGRPCAARSTWGSRTSTWPTTTGRRPAARRSTSAGSCARTCGPTATSWSSRPRPATACGPAPTATAARASTCWLAWTSRCSGWAWSTWTSSTPTGTTRTRCSKRRWAPCPPPCGKARPCTRAFLLIRRSGPGRLLTSVLDQFCLDGRVAIVTGASSGLGVGFAQALAQAGADLVLAARREEKMAGTSKLVEAESRRAVTVRADISNPDDCTAVVTVAMNEFGRVDVLVNNAGVGTAVPATQETPEQFRSVIDINLNGCYWMAQACGRVMRPGTSIINISSILGFTSLGLPQAAYSASKAGLIGLTRDLAQQWTGRKGVRVNALAPGYFASEMTDQFEDDFVTERVVPRTVTGRLGAPGELNGALIFLASDASSYITGITLSVDGGILTS